MRSARLPRPSSAVELGSGTKTALRTRLSATPSSRLMLHSSLPFTNPLSSRMKSPDSKPVMLLAVAMMKVEAKASP
jgi:hypothetical protein